MSVADYRAIIAETAAAHQLDPRLVEAVVAVESSGNTDAFRFEPGFYELYLRGKREYAGQIPRRISSSYGLMQVMATTARQHGFTGEPEELFVPRVGLEYGCRHLAMLLRWAKGDVPKALGAYNAGQGNWDDARGRAYAVKVEKALPPAREVRT